MSYVDTVGSSCMKEQLKKDKEWFCACRKCEKAEFEASFEDEDDDVVEAAPVKKKQVRRTKAEMEAARNQV